ncbi:MAG: heme ABC exporter ATP-binding protein CcmA [Lachnospiraceae bacterium]|nr:heme ABC exporter ATP-binding protein CcmA [Lachnospiraceae bacterium]
MNLSIRNLSKEADNVSILNRIDLEVKSGEAVALVGANGAGKTSLLNCILGIYSRYSGEILIDGTDVKSRKSDTLREKVAFVPDTTGLFAPLTAWENIEFYDRMYNPKSSGDERKARIERIFEEISLKGKENMVITKFSKGMKQRLSIGRTMVIKPELILLDEPYLGLDVEGKEFLTEHLRKLKNKGCTILLSSHDLTEIEKVCDKAVFIKQGEIRDEKPLSNYETEKSELEMMYAKVLM